MKFGAMLQQLHRSFQNSAGTIVFGMEDGTVSIFGLIFGVAATTSNPKTVLIAGASGAVAAAVSMMAGAYLDIETTRDKAKASRLSAPSVAEADLFEPPIAHPAAHGQESRHCSPARLVPARPSPWRLPDRYRRAAAGRELRGPRTPGAARLRVHRRGQRLPRRAGLSGGRAARGAGSAPDGPDPELRRARPLLLPRRADLARATPVGPFTVKSIPEV